MNTVLLPYWLFLISVSNLAVLSPNEFIVKGLISVPSRQISLYPIQLRSLILFLQSIFEMNKLFILFIVIQDFVEFRYLQTVDAEPLDVIRVIFSLPLLSSRLPFLTLSLQNMTSRPVAGPSLHLWFILLRKKRPLPRNSNNPPLLAHLTVTAAVPPALSSRSDCENMPLILRDAKKKGPLRQSE